MKTVKNKDVYCAVCPYGKTCEDRKDPKVHIKVMDDSLPEEGNFWCTRR